MRLEHSRLARIAALLDNPVFRVWFPALLITLILLMTLGISLPSERQYGTALLLLLLIVLGQRLSVQLEDGSPFTPTPALLIAGLTMVGWPLLVLITLLSSAVTLVHRRQTVEHALIEAGSHYLIIGLSVPVYYATQPAQALPYSTPMGLLGLGIIGLITYTIKLIIGVDGDTHIPRLRRLRRRLAAVRWYGLAIVPLGGLLGALWAFNAWLWLLSLGPLVVAQRLFTSAIALRSTSADLANIAQQRELLNARVERLQALATAMLSTRDVQPMLELLCQRLAALLDAPAGWVMLFDDTAHLQLMTYHNLPGAEHEPLADPQLYLALLERGKVMLVADERASALVPGGRLHHRPEWLAVLCIPLLGESSGPNATPPLLGAICLAFNRLRGLHADEQRVLSSFAHQAAMAIENARLFAELRRKQDELIQSSKLAAVGTFAAGIAHEFNNLLGSMLGYAELGHKIHELEEKDRALEVVIQACRRGRSITRGLLTFARRQEHHRTMADLTDAVDETLTLVDIDLRKSRIKVVRKIEPIPLTVCDLGQMSQVVLNLITNARDAMRPDGGTLTVSLRERRDQIELSISDTGTGIDTAIRDKIFEPFMTTKGALGGSQTPGTGLGLSVSYGIVQEHGGTVVVDSTPGHGTTMTVRLPIVTAEVLEHELAVSA